MKLNPKLQTSLFEGGKDIWERTDEFKRKVNQLKQEIRDKYQPVLATEKNWFKRLLIKTRVWLESRRRIDEIKSSRNLHFSA